MKISVQKLAKSQIELRIEVPIEEFNGFIEKAILSLGKDLEIEGFRKGKAPKEMIEKSISQERILTTAADYAVQENYTKAISEKNIEAIAAPEIEILKMAKNNPFEFKAKVWVMSEIELPDYQKIISGIKRKKVEVTKEEIEKMRQEKEKWEKERLRQEILEKIAEKCKLEIPEILIEQEKKRMLENVKRGVLQTLQISFEEYLKKINKTEKQLLDSFGPEVEKRIKSSLVLKQIGEKEKILVSDQEIEEELKKSPGFGFQKDIDSERLKSYTKEILKHEKAFSLLESFLKN